MPDDVIGDSTYIELADGMTATVGVIDDLAVLVIPGGGAHVLTPEDAVRIGQALVERGQQASAASQPECEHELITGNITTCRKCSARWPRSEPEAR